MRICTKCKIEKDPDNDFYWRNKTKGYKHSWCKECCAFIDKKRTNWPSKEEKAKYNKQYHNKNHERIKLQQNGYYNNNRIKRCSAQRMQNLKYKNLTLDNFNKLFIKQGGKCAICQASKPGGRTRFHVDHDHLCCPGQKTCGKCTRGILCNRCDIALGGFHDSGVILQNAINYLNKNTFGYESDIEGLGI